VRFERHGFKGSAWLACALVALGLLGGCAAHRGSRIVLTNQMAGEVTHVKISWDGGGEQHYDIVAPQQTVTVTMTEIKTKSFTIGMTLPDGTKYERVIPPAFDPGYTGGVTITVEADGRVGWSEHFERK